MNHIKLRICVFFGAWLVVLLETVDALNLGCSTSQLALTVTKRDSPSNQLFQCPLFVICDAPVFTKVCIGSPVTTCQNPEPPFPNNAQCSTGGRMLLNPLSGDFCGESPPDPGQYIDCTIGVARATWTKVKSLYQK